MKNQFTISSAYVWPKNGNGKSNSELAIKKIAEIIKQRFSKNKSENETYPISYRRLRASAGKTMLDSIIKRIETSNVVIIDITQDNKNVFIEAGIALAISKAKKSLSVYFIREQNTDLNLPQGIPSDLQGYFISEYVVEEKNGVTFKDNNSLRMSIESDVKDYFNRLKNIFINIDEISEYECCND